MTRLTPTQINTSSQTESLTLSDGLRCASAIQNASVLILLFIGVVATSSSLCGGGELGPRIVLDPMVVDLGHQFSDLKVPVSIEVKNTGSQPLVINGVHATCSCLSSDSVWPDSLKPGEKGRVRLVVETRKLPLNVSKKIIVSSNDKRTPKAELKLVGKVEKVFSISNPSVFFRKVLPGKKPEVQKVGILSLTRTPIAVRAPAAAGPFRFKLFEMDRGRRWELHVTPSVSLKDGMNKAIVKVSTTHVRQKTIPIEISAFRPPALVALPPSLMIPSEPLNRATNRIITFRGREGESWSIVSNTSPDKRLTFKTERFDAQSEQLWIFFPEGYALPEAGNTRVNVTCQRDGFKNWRKEFVINIQAEPPKAGNK